jgi:hypothetical protein
MSRSSASTLSAVAVVLAGWAGCAFAQTADVPKSTELTTAAIANSLLLDSTGLPIGALALGEIDTTELEWADVPVTTRTSVPTGITMSTLAPPLSPTPSTATVRVPRSLTVGYCANSASLYDKRTGKCTDGKFPSKIVPLLFVTHPSAKTPTLACPEPRVPTFSAATLKWSCIIPTGFKLSIVR